MAIYDVDAIREQDLTAERDGILDNMLEACDNMLTALDESKARRRVMEYLDKDAKSKDETADSLIKLRNSGIMSSKTNDKLSDKINDLKFNAEVSRKGKSMIDPSSYGDDPIEGGKKAEKVFKDMFNATPVKEAKKKAIKETCLTILSVLDEI